MNDILVAVDGSKHSSKIVDVGIQLAKAFSAGIILVYVIHTPGEEPEGVKSFEKVEQYPEAYADYLQGLGESVTDQLTDVIQKAGLKVRAITPSGNPANEILNIADVETPTMIVLGVKGMHGIRRFLTLGSVARNVIENARVPVVTVPPFSA